MLQTGVQILGGFLLILPFQERFGDLDRFQVGLYLVLVALAAVTTAVMLAPIAVHRRVFRKQRKELIVTTGHRLARIITALIGVLVTGVAMFVFDVVVGRGFGFAVGATMSVVVLFALVIVPRHIAHL